jgi:hypothetical protein
MSRTKFFVWASLACKSRLTTHLQHCALAETYRVSMAWVSTASARLRCLADLDLLRSDWLPLDFG